MGLLPIARQVPHKKLLRTSFSEGPRPRHPARTPARPGASEGGPLQREAQRLAQRQRRVGPAALGGEATPARPHHGGTAPEPCGGPGWQ